MNGNGTKQGAAQSSWIAHVKGVMHNEGCSYKEALKRASSTYTKRRAISPPRARIRASPTANGEAGSSAPKPGAPIPTARQIAEEVVRRRNQADYEKVRILGKKAARMLSAQNAKARREGV